MTNDQVRHALLELERIERQAEQIIEQTHALAGKLNEWQHEQGESS